MLQTSINEKAWKTEKVAAYQTRIDVILSQSPFVSICSYWTVRFTATYSPVFPVNEKAKLFVCVSKQILPCGQYPFHKCVFLFPSGPFISGSVSLYSSNVASLSIRVAISVSAGTEKGWKQEGRSWDISQVGGKLPFHASIHSCVERKLHKCLYHRRASYKSCRTVPSFGS